MNQIITDPAEFRNLLLEEVKRQHRFQSSTLDDLKSKGGVESVSISPIKNPLTDSNFPIQYGMLTSWLLSDKYIFASRMHT